MILGTHDLRECFRDGGPWEAFKNGQKVNSEDLRIGPNSIDVTLHNKILIPNNKTCIDPYDKHTSLFTQHTIHNNGYLLGYGKSILASTNERFDCTIPYAGCRYVQMIEGRSTLGRLFLNIHSTAGFGDYGFKGAFTLEITNLSPWWIMLYPFMRIAQVYFQQVSLPQLYEGAYNGQEHYDGPIAPTLGPDRF